VARASSPGSIGSLRTSASISCASRGGRPPTSKRPASIATTRLDRDDTVDADIPFLGRIDGADPADIVRRREIAARLQSALDALPSYHRAVIVMREIDGLSYEEMAQAMNVSKGTIMSRLFHARQKLQKALADCYAEQVGAHPHDGPPLGAGEGEP
jgi:RNA polymerase sigma-70 factor (ECF subfamily)